MRKKRGGRKDEEEERREEGSEEEERREGDIIPLQVLVPYLLTVLSVKGFIVWYLTRGCLLLLS